MEALNFYLGYVCLEDLVSGVYENAFISGFRVCIVLTFSWVLTPPYCMCVTTEILLPRIRNCFLYNAESHSSVSEEISHFPNTRARKVGLTFIQFSFLLTIMPFGVNELHVSNMTSSSPDVVLSFLFLVATGHISCWSAFKYKHTTRPVFHMKRLSNNIKKRRDTLFFCFPYTYCILCSHYYSLLARRPWNALKGTFC